MNRTACSSVRTRGASCCGTALTLASSAAPAPKPAQAVGAPIGPVVLTAAVAAAIIALSFIRIVNLEGGSGFVASFDQPTWMAPTTIGLAPFLGSFIVVELIALIPALCALGAANIPAFPRSGHYRVLLGFFAPYAPVTLLVPVSRPAEARAILDR